MATKKTKSAAPVQVDAVKHQDKRANIPTEELRGFVREEDAAPRTVEYPGLLYARDPSLDPQLVWKGKDEQDRKPLTVPSVPVYIQEKIHPQAIIEDVRAQAKKDNPDAQLNLFSDFNGIKFEDLIDFYKHESNWSNRMILGDSLLVMTSLAERERLKGKVQMVYIDPPYGIKFGSNWQVSTRKRDVKDGKAEDATRQPEQIRAFRDTWELGIHSYLAYWRDRLVAARDLLTETGSVFVQIGDENVHLVRCVLDEVFGVENFVSTITAVKTSSATSDFLAGVADTVLFYTKSKDRLKYRQLYREKEIGEEGTTQYTWLVSKDRAFRRRLTDQDEGRLAELAADFDVFAADNLTSQRPPGDFPVFFEGKTFRPGKGYWKTHQEGFARLGRAGRFEPIGNTLMYRRLFADFSVSPINSIWRDVLMTGFSEAKTYVVQTSSKIIERCLLMTTDPGDLVLDPTCGSGTTAYVAEQWGRRWITCDTSRVALALARTRLMTSRFPYYLLADSPEGQKKESATASQLPASGATANDIRKGFVCKRVPHVTLKAIANNEEIDAIHARWQPKLDAAFQGLEKAIPGLSKDWEVPREAPPKAAKNAAALLEEWWTLKRQRQAEIDASIARRADTETLHDQPYEDAKRIRVTGPFTVESLSPHRSIDLAKRPKAKAAYDEPTPRGVGTEQFGNIIIENLKKAGVQNTIKNERLKFDRLEHHAGLWVHAAGEYTDKAGKSRRVAVCIGPEHGTVGAELIREAALEAVQGLGHDVLIVCGFAFDPGVGEEAKKYGKLTVLPTRINADLQMGDEFLKKTGAANLFTVFGEPDIEWTKEKDGRIVVEIRGLDVYDPTTGQIRNSTTDDIACWFVDTDYNGRSFFVRHAYFTGAGDPYEKLKRALKAEIDEAAWSALYSTKSRPFDCPKSGKIAVKVINHYGDEVLKVYDLGKG